MLEEVHLGVHLEHLIGGSLVDDEAVSEVVGNSLVDILVEDDFFKIGRAVLPVIPRNTSSYLYLEAIFNFNFSSKLSQYLLDQLIILGFKKLNSVLVSQLDGLQLPQDLGVHHSQMVIHRTVEYKVVQLEIDRISCSSQSLNSIELNYIKQVFDSLEKLLFWR
eukprot:CAMPEP_0170485008 /NCGR_PEP_ID=MMETSP0208-20121228/4369_1 /TAXON_ID=197538 /ORGANISM="Strombidium inclinatum, Strain S3" /LENGTH=162 /DNA_ID=CAMNT_0010758533 /DNA_START=2924 /DNA_END=3412 /DNA_ORIENTATION=+